MSDKPLLKKLGKLFGSNQSTSGQSNSNSDSIPEQIDSTAALDSFRTHWSQAYRLMSRKVLHEITVDDITSIVNHIEQMVFLLVQESDSMAFNMRSSDDETSSSMMSPLLDYLLVEEVLQKLLSWSEVCGQWQRIMVLEQLKLYEILVSLICHNSALFQQPLVRPLLGLLVRFVDKPCDSESEKRLVVLLNTLFVCLSHNMHVLELLFLSEPLISSHIETKFIIFSLLIPFVHRDGPVGQQARDAILLCMALSRRNDLIGQFVAQETDFCPVLATGLSGLFSSLPRRLLCNSIGSDDWHQITSDDICENPELQLFLNCLEFCNAVAQISHPLVQQVLLDFVYNGFLVPVIGPALHQNTLEEIISTTAYVDLCVRTITEPNLLKIFLQFLCMEKYEGERIMATLITRIMANSKLSLVTLVLFRSLLELNCEDLLLELVLKHLRTGNHLIGGIDHQLQRINDCNCLNDSAHKFLSMIPKCCLSSHLDCMNGNPVPTTASGPQGFIFLGGDGDGHDSHPSIAETSITENGDEWSAKEVKYLLFNYLDYLSDANIMISNCIRATRSWSCKYEAIPTTRGNGVNCNNPNNNNNATDSAINDNYDSHLVPQTNGSSKQTEEETEEEEDESSYEPIGSFLQTLLSRLEAFTENDVYTNLQLTGLISRLTAYPQPLIRSFLLNPTLVFHQNRSLVTILTDISKKLDQSSVQIKEFNELLRTSRHFLYGRENRTLNRRQSFSSQLETEMFRKSLPTRVRRDSISSISSQISVTEGKRVGRFESLKNMFKSTPKMMRRSRTESTSLMNPPILEAVDGQTYKYNPHKPGEGPDPGVEAYELEENQRIQKVVLAAIVFEEFVRELSAISYEHYILEYSDPSIPESKPK